MSREDGQTRIINAMAPIRICDLGGWTDTWFAGTGAVFNIGVYPYAEVQIYARETPPGQDREIAIHAENFGDRYVLDPGPIEYDRHPLLEACIDIMEIPENLSFEINLYSSAPAGCSTGTSAAVSVALLGALDLLSAGRMTPHEIAATAHRVETEKLGLQCGIQDQICSAYGGICFIEMFAYPR
ncbi:MAG TPA: GHMP kinase, partial [Candidatus Hydrogenedentes bacterium]|nr:GHMP kinase [Candidatus Hydrogenedentota bacterium]